jgi:hypothetical protein
LKQEEARPSLAQSLLWQRLRGEHQGKPGPLSPQAM